MFNASVTPTIAEEYQGKNINLCHIVMNPDTQVIKTLAIDAGAIGIVSVSPGEIAVIAADYLSKKADIEIVFIDRYLGTVLTAGGSEALKTAFLGLINMLSSDMSFETACLTFS